MRKYEDLAERIHEDGVDAYWDEIGAVLRWLDEHPDQVPGRTITESELIAAVDETNHEDMNEYQKARALLVHLGHTVADPEPTIPVPTEPGARFIAHSPKLSDDPEDQREFVIAGQYIVALDSAAVYSRELFEDAGWVVTALVRAGSCTAPDPETTNAEKLKAVLDAIGDSTGGYREHLASRLDEAGVKAPGGDDE